MSDVKNTPRNRTVEDACIWMKAGVVDMKICNEGFDCMRCKYDQTMSRLARQNVAIMAGGGTPAGRKGSIIPWQDAMRAKPPQLRMCRHTMNGRIENRHCAHNYDCHDCDFDQMFEDAWEIRVPIVLEEVPQIRGYQVPEGYYYHSGHAWAKIQPAGRIRIGLDDFGAKLVGPLEKLDLPKPGYEVNKNQASWSLHRQSNMADILSPVDGVVLEVNPKIRRRPELTNDEPFEGGWVMVIQAANLKKDIKQLHFGQEANDFITSESDKLFGMVEEVAGPLSADGGQLVSDIYGNLPDLGWERLTKTFFRS